MKRLLCLTVSMMTAWPASAAAQERHVFLFDYSGSMSAFYSNGATALEMLSSLIVSQTRDRDEVVVLFFSKNDPQRQITSPIKALDGRRRGAEIADVAIAERLKAFNHPQGDTDLTSSVESAQKVLAGTGGRIWLLTDNIQDLGQQDGDDTRGFYEFLKGNGRLQAIHCFPIRAQAYNGVKGLAFYGMYFSKPNASLSAEAIRGVTFGSQYLLKLSPKGPLICRPLTLSVSVPPIAMKAGRLLLSAVEGQAREVEVPGVQLRSLLPSHQVVEAALAGQLIIQQVTDPSIRSKGLSIAVVPGRYRSASGETTGPYLLRISIPALTPQMSWQSVLESAFHLDGNLVIRASRARLRVNSELGEELTAVAGLGDLPDFFQPSQGEISSLGLPVRVDVRYALWRLFLVFGGLLSALLAVGVGAWVFFTGKRVAVQVDHEPERTPVRLLPLSPLQVRSADDRAVTLGTVTWRPLAGVSFVPARKTRIVEPNRQVVKVTSHSAFRLEHAASAGAVRSYTVTIKLVASARTQAPEAGARSRVRGRYY